MFMSISPRNFNPLDAGTPVKEVDENGVTTGKTFVSRAWNTHNRPKHSEEGCPIWIHTIIVADTLEAANSGKALLKNVATVASSSPSSRDVTVVYVDAEGKKLKEFKKPYLLVPHSEVPAGATEPTAKEIWLSDKPFNPKTTKIAALEQSCADTTK
jgi:hypothetical protein